MTLDDAKMQLEALPGVYDVSVESWRTAWWPTEEVVQFQIRIASPNLIPEETRQGILRIWDILKRELGCIVWIAVSAGLRMPSS